LHFGAEVEWMPRAESGLVQCAWRWHACSQGWIFKFALCPQPMVRFLFPRPTLRRLLSSQNAGGKQLSFIHIFLQNLQSSFTIFICTGRNLLGSSSGSFSKLDQPCHPIPTLRLKPAGHLPKFPAVLKDSENGSRLRMK
jgi:hypothetical protein